MPDVQVSVLDESCFSAMEAELRKEQGSLFCMYVCIDPKAYLASEKKKQPVYTLVPYEEVEELTQEATELHL